MQENTSGIQGLNEAQVRESRKKYGANTLVYKKERGLVRIVLGLVKEPMFILLLSASLIYFIGGETADAVFLLCAIVFQASISLYQDTRSRNALEKLKDFSQPRCRVIRDGRTQEIRSEDLVKGDIFIVEEGGLVPADGRIVRSNDFSLNESLLTGESLPVHKDSSSEEPFVYSGSSVLSGLAVIEAEAVGNATRLGKIGGSLASIREEKTPLEIKIGNFVKKMAIAGAVVFVLVWGINYLRSGDLSASLLQALTLAMSILPEEIPVAFTTFMALGAWRLMKTGIVVKQMKTVETLGSATVICTDKTGTITENKMSLARLYLYTEDRLVQPGPDAGPAAQDLLHAAMWASEPIPFDPMEISLHEAYTQWGGADERPLFRMEHEYPLSGKPPMMTHIFNNGQGKRIIAAKGAPEALMQVAGLAADARLRVETALKELAGSGYRVLGVGTAAWEGERFPETQQEFRFTFLGLLAFYDPPRSNMPDVLQQFYQAGIRVKIITGDNMETTLSIARQIGFRGAEKAISGAELMTQDEETLRRTVQDTEIFVRMFPEAKLRIINALKANGEIVAMTGDGVNDGPALKAAHIGIAMGKKGTEIAREAASLILLNDDLSAMTTAVAMGRKIYTNLKKAIRYIISIHIPIILAVFIPLALGWIYPNIFSPLHVIFLELIMGPTCSIIYENEPVEKNTMLLPPRPFTRTFFNFKELLTSMIQGLVITVAILAVYRYAAALGYSEALTRTMVFSVLVTANIFLTLVNRSFYYSMLHTLRYPNRLLPMIIGITVLLSGLLIFIKPLAAFFLFEAMDLQQTLLCIAAGFVSVTWFELFKWGIRLRSARK